MYEQLRNIARNILPERTYRVLALPWHFCMAFAAAAYYHFPSRHMMVIGVTGTNGKSTVVEMLHAICAAAGMRVASISSIRANINGAITPNTRKMTMAGRLRTQQFLHDAHAKQCKVAIVEVTSEGIRQFRHKFIHFDIAVLTNITPEHIESHGSFEKYVAAKRKLFEIAPHHVLNRDDTQYHTFSSLSQKQVSAYGKADIAREQLRLQLHGTFNMMNALAALHAARLLGINDTISRSALAQIASIPGRFEIIANHPRVIVDYAHTPDALTQVYMSARTDMRGKLICVLGGTGGGRDKWKRAQLGHIASEHCDAIFITNEDPYDENPDHIMRDVASGVRREYQIVPERAKAIHRAIFHADEDDTVIITGKGSETVMAVEGGALVPWDDREVARRTIAEMQRR